MRHVLQQRMVSPRQLAEEAIHAEQQLLGTLGVARPIKGSRRIPTFELGPGSTWSAKNLLPKDYLRVGAACLVWFQRDQPNCRAACQEQGQHQAGGPRRSCKPSPTRREAPQAFQSHANFEQLGSSIRAERSKLVVFPQTDE